MSLPRAGETRQVPGCAVTANAFVRAPVADVPGLRADPGRVGGQPLPGRFLKNADEQTVVGLAAVLKAIGNFPPPDESWLAWGVVAAPRFLARFVTSSALDQFDRTGPPGVSPLLVPHHSLHSVSATISLALGSRGPNFGVGNGVGALAQGLLMGLTVQVDSDLPGTWLVLTEWDPEPDPDARGQCSRPAVCQAVALALQPLTPDHEGLVVRLVDGGTTTAIPPLRTLVRFLELRGLNPGCLDPWVCPLGWDAQIEFTTVASQLQARGDSPRTPCLQARGDSPRTPSGKRISCSPVEARR